MTQIKMTPPKQKRGLEKTLVQGCLSTGRILSQIMYLPTILRRRKKARMVILVAKLMMMKILLEVVVMTLTVRPGWERCLVYTVYCEVLESEQSINTVKIINVDIDSYGDDNSHDDAGNGER